MSHRLLQTSIALTVLLAGCVSVPTAGVPRAQAAPAGAPVRIDVAWATPTERVGDDDLAVSKAGMVAGGAFAAGAVTGAAAVSSGALGVSASAGGAAAAPFVIAPFLLTAFVANIGAGTANDAFAIVVPRHIPKFPDATMTSATIARRVGEPFGWTAATAATTKVPSLKVAGEAIFGPGLQTLALRFHVVYTDPTLDSTPVTCDLYVLSTPLALATKKDGPTRKRLRAVIDRLYDTDGLDARTSRKVAWARDYRLHRVDMPNLYSEEQMLLLLDDWAAADGRALAEAIDAAALTLARELPRLLAEPNAPHRTDLERKLQMLLDPHRIEVQKVAGVMAVETLADGRTRTRIKSKDGAIAKKQFAEHDALLKAAAEDAAD